MGPMIAGCDDCLDARRTLEAENHQLQQRIQALEQERDRAKLAMLDQVEAKIRECEAVGARFSSPHITTLRASLTHGQEPTTT